MENKTLTHVRQKHLDLCWKDESAPCLKHGCPISMYLQRPSLTHIYTSTCKTYKVALFLLLLFTCVKLQPFNNITSPLHTYSTGGGIMGPAIGVGCAGKQGEGAWLALRPQIPEVPSRAGWSCPWAQPERIRWKPGSGEERGDKNRSDARLTTKLRPDLPVPSPASRLALPRLSYFALTLCLPS